MSPYLYRIARWCFRRRRTVVAIWLIAVIAIGATAKLAGGKTNNSFTMPGTESQQVISALEQKLPAASGVTTQVVFASHDGTITGAKDVAAIRQTLAALKRMPQVEQVTDPFATKSISPDGQLALATVYYDTSSITGVKNSTVNDLRPSVHAAQAAGLQVEFTGEIYPQSTLNAMPEMVGVAVALLVLAFTFGSLLAAGLPILTALIGVAASMFAILALAAVVNVNEAATIISVMLGLSCGIDYSLFIFTRYRQHLIAGDDPEEAAGFAAGTAGGSVVFAALSVVVALAGLSLIGLPFLTVMGLCAAGTVLISLGVATTLLPAIFGFFGERAARFSKIKGLRHVQQAASAAVHDPNQTAGHRWESWVTRHRGAVLVVGVAAMLTLSIPVLRMDLAMPSGATQPTSSTSRRAYDLTSKHFGTGYNGTLTVLAERVTSRAQAQRIATGLGQLDHVAAAEVGAVTNGIALITVVPTTGPTSNTTKNLVQYIRHDRATLAAGTGAHLLVGGMAAIDIDISAKLGSALPLFVGVVVGLAFVLLSIAFRTFWVPTKSIVGFLLSIGAALGAQVAVFQWGWGASLLGVPKGPTLSFLPIVLLAIMFGLSSDYEVFVVSRIKEYHTKHGDAEKSVVMGAGQSARVVSAAALIMASVFGSFMLASDPMIKMIGFCFAFGVLIDAFVVRLTLVPAVMSLLGERAWSAPKWFAKVPDPDIEGELLERKLGTSSKLHAGGHGAKVQPSPSPALEEA